MSSSEIAFLALGLVLGAAIGAAFVEAVRSRPAPRREVRITIAPNSVNPRRPATLATPDAGTDGHPIPGSPEEAAWPELVVAAPGGPVSAAAGGRFPIAETRTGVPTGGVSLPATAIGVPISRHPTTGARPDGGMAPGLGRGVDAASASLRPPTAVGVLDPVAPLTTAELARVTTTLTATAPSPVVPLPATPERPVALPATAEVGVPAPDRVVRLRPPAEALRPYVPPTAVPIAIDGRNGNGHAGAGSDPRSPHAMADRPVSGASRDDAAGRTGDAAGAGPDAPSSPASTDPCNPIRHLLDERCAVATGAAEQARIAADALRDAQRAYDILRERVDQAHSHADPRELAAAKDALHRAFRLASGSAVNADQTEAAAREWLTRINELNTRAREAMRIVESGGAELRAALPRLERLTVDADAARIAAEGAEAACHEARERLAECEEAQAAGRLAALTSPRPEEPSTYESAWPSQPMTPFEPSDEGEAAGAASLQGLPAVVRVLRGDRGARERLVVTLAGGGPEDYHVWQIRVAQLADAITARAIEAGYLDLPEDDVFWGLFSRRESREIVGALSALGFRYDGMGGFADGRVPAPRDLSLAVGYAGLDRMRIRVWPGEAELSSLYARAVVAADEWLADEAGDLTLGTMVDALGSRAADLADTWNAWGRMRPALLALD